MVVKEAGRFQPGKPRNMQERKAHFARMPGPQALAAATTALEQRINIPKKMINKSSLALFAIDGSSFSILGKGFEKR